MVVKSNQRLKDKILRLSFLPTLSLIFVLVVFPLRLNLMSFIDSVKLSNRFEIMSASSAVINETQKERGMSAGYLNGGIKLEDLNKQRKINDEKIKVLMEKMQGSSFSDNMNEEIISSVNAIAPLRKSIESKSIPIKDAIATYNSTIKVLLNIQRHISLSTNNLVVSNEIMTHLLLEEVKESGGKLRANMTAIFSKNSSISEQKLKQIMNLMSGVTAGIKSPAIVKTDETSGMLDEFSFSKEWIKTKEDFLLIIKTFQSGEYNRNAKQFFNQISTALSFINKYINVQGNILKKEVNHLFWMSLGYFAFTVGFIAIFTLLLIKQINKMTNEIEKSIANIISTLKDTTTFLSQGSSDLCATSEGLSSSAEEQAASVQETAASLNEISEMIRKSSEYAEQSKSDAETTLNITYQGKKNFESMLNAVEKVDKANKKTVQLMSDNNKDFSEIVNIVNLIKKKTQIINDIVSKTQLLSFNASIEAARAGEHGKGFAVVAEEVGNLANLSGEASHEIFEILNSSTQKVDSILERSKSSITELESEINLILHECKDIVESSNGDFEKILHSVKDVTIKVEEISSACKQQEIGVSEISKAVEQLNLVSGQNSSAAINSSKLSNQVENNTKSINNVVINLVEIIEGKKEASKKKAA